MPTVSSSFEASGVSLALQVRPGESLSYTLSMDGADEGIATVFLQSTENYQTWRLERTTAGDDITFTGTVAAPLVTAIGSGTIVNETNTPRFYRWACRDFDAESEITEEESDPILYTLVNGIDTIESPLKSAELKGGVIANQDGTTLFQVDEDGVQVLRRADQKLIVNAAVLAKVGAGSGFVVAAADDVALVTCPASQAAATLVIPIPALKVGSIITGFHLIGQIESAGNAVTVDADLRKQTAAAADVADASVGAITQLSVIADTAMSATNTRKASLSETVGADETFYVLITATTLGSTDIALQGVAIEYTEI